MRSLLLCLMITLGSLNALSQPWAGNEPCLPDCPESLFGAPQQCTLTVNGCLVVLDYRTRVACGIWNDIYIDGYTTLGTGCGHGTWGNPTLQQQLHASVVKAFLESGCVVAFTPPAGQCNTQWRVSMGSCWVVDFLVPVGETGQLNFWYACTTETCCLDRFTVCRDQSGGITATKTSNNPVECPPGTSFMCFPACNSIYR